MKVIIDCAKTTIYDLLIAYTTARMRAEIERRGRLYLEIKQRIDADHDVLIVNGKVTSWPTEKGRKW
jgi:hypothetical protein